MAEFWQALIAGLAGDEQDRWCLTIWSWFFFTTVVMLVAFWIYDWFVLYPY